MTHVFDRPGIVQEVLGEFVGVLLPNYGLCRLDDIPAVFNQQPAIWRKLALVDASDQIPTSGSVRWSPPFHVQVRKTTHGECSRTQVSVFSIC
jgi:hypothetical protein